MAVVVIAVAVFGPLLAPQDPDALVGSPFASPSGSHLLGLDYLGRDAFSRFLCGGQTTIVLALLGTVLGGLIGIVTGTLAAYARGFVDGIFNRTTEVLLSLPGLILILLFLGSFGTSLTVVVIAVGIANAPRVARIARGAALDVRERAFVELARGRGERVYYILFKEMLPNIAAPIGVDLGLRFTSSIIAVASVSFLGLGLQPPAADWGLIISENRSGLLLQPWAVLLPVVAIGSLTVGVNLVMDGVSRRIGRSDQLLEADRSLR
jgi:ABC-type dipeptide/oligopeptide/nickel transport system permease subunit